MGGCRSMKHIKTYQLFENNEDDNLFIDCINILQGGITSPQLWDYSPCLWQHAAFTDERNSYHLEICPDLEVGYHEVESWIKQEIDKFWNRTDAQESYDSSFCKVSKKNQPIKIKKESEFNIALLRRTRKIFLDYPTSLKMYQEDTKCSEIQAVCFVYLEYKRIPPNFDPIWKDI